MSEVLQLEQHLTEAMKLVAVRDMALKLSENRDFKKLILEEFCVQECARYARESADPALPEHSRADALAIAQAAGHLKRWLSIQIQIGNTAASQIGDIESALEEVRAEQGE